MYSGIHYICNNSCTIKRKAESTNSKNQIVKGAESTIISNLRCRLIPSGGKEVIDGKRVVVSDYTLFIPFSTNIETEDTVIIGSDTFLVEFITHNPGNSEHHKEVLLKLVES